MHLRPTAAEPEKSELNPQVARFVAAAIEVQYMSINPVASQLPLSQVKVSPTPPRKRKTRITVEHEDDDWIPTPTTRLPTRTATEFFDNDYDLM
jgi:hypothetical protein